MAAIRGHFRRGTDPYFFVLFSTSHVPNFKLFFIKYTILLKIVTYPPHYGTEDSSFTLVNVYVDLLVFTRIAGTS